MIRDFQGRDEFPSAPAEVCIVGAGAAGIALARELIGTGLRVVVLESGDTTRAEEVDDLYRSVVEGRPHAGIHRGRARVLGGTTTLWGGQALPLFPLDFEPREWVPQSGWPIRERDIAPYYPCVLRLLGLRENAFRSDVRHVQGRAKPEFTPDSLELFYSQWSPAPDLAVAYRRELAAADNLELWLNANVVGIAPAATGTSISYVEVRSLQGRTTRVSAQYFVLCVGGIETARLMLASRSLSQPHGIGNAQGLVGRYFQDHLAFRCGRIVPLNWRRFRGIFDQSFNRRVKFYPKLAATPALQRRERILSVIGNVYGELPPKAGILYAKALARDLRARRWSAFTPRRVGRAMLGGLELAPAAWRVVAQRRVYTSPKSTIFLEAHVEQAPDPESQVLLSDTEHDALGMPRSVMRWRPSAVSARSALVFARTVAAEFARLGLARVDLELPAGEDGAQWEGLGGDLNHHIGTARMSDDPRFGVTDAHCRVHGFPNLYVASSAVFPTGGSSNPTFTLLALTYRIADDLRRTFCLNT